jgi:uncharacterized phage protein (TIGR01671 family)
MNQIKFRAWDVINKKMYPQAFPTWNGMTEGKIDLIEHKVEVIDADGDDMPIVMQFTGLQDKNGVDIYEGDILSVINKCFSHTGEPLIIKFGLYEDAEQYVHDSHYGYNLDGMPLNDCIKDGSHVIGNIHQNPELIK